MAGRYGYQSTRVGLRLCWWDWVQLGWAGVMCSNFLSLTGFRSFTVCTTSWSVVSFVCREKLLRKEEEATAPFAPDAP
jgi:hypothetical protein